MTVHTIMMVRNEMGRYLTRSLASARAVAQAGGGKLIVTDDASTDYTPQIAEAYADEIQYNLEPMFWRHEGRARQKHLDFAGRFMQDGDWVLSLDADETISDPDTLVNLAATVKHDVIGLPLYEFWTPEEYRVDGYWFGTQATRMFRWQSGARIADKAMACGSEPLYVQDAVARGLWSNQTDVHLLHWGYLNPEDRVRKHRAYTGRLGGHGHSNQHINSIIQAPQLKTYA